MSPIGVNEDLGFFKINFLLIPFKLSKNLIISFIYTLLFEEKINFVVQINGKKRGILNVKRNFSEEKIFQKIINDKNISKYVADKKIKKKIFIPNKLINIIV